MNIKLRNDNVLVEVITTHEEVTESGLLIRDEFRRYTKGKVLLVGPGKITKQDVIVIPTVKEGDLVMIEKNRGTEIKYEGKTCLVVKETEIYCVEE